MNTNLSGGGGGVCVSDSHKTGPGSIHGISLFLFDIALKYRQLPLLGEWNAQYKYLIKPS